MSGLFITMEGTDGAGKTTQIKLLEKYFLDSGFEVVCSREPGGTPISEKIREIIIDPENEEMCPMAEALLYAAARAQHVHEFIEPNLKKGRVVICDRFLDSSIVYQGIARKLGIDNIKDINSYATNGLVPDITFFLRLSPEDGIERKKKQAELDRIEKEKFYFHKKVYDGYVNLAREESERIVQIDALLSVEEISAQIIASIEKLLSERSF